MEMKGPNKKKKKKKKNESISCTLETTKEEKCLQRGSTWKWGVGGMNLYSTSKFREFSRNCIAEDAVCVARVSTLHA